MTDIVHYQQAEHQGEEVVVVTESILSVVRDEMISYYLENDDYGDVPGLAEFNDDFELHATGALGEDSDFYYGQDQFVIIKRRTDGKLFGFKYWQGGGKYGELQVEPNGDEYGFEEVENLDVTEGDTEYDELENPEYFYFCVFFPVKLAPIEAWNYVVS